MTDFTIIRRSLTGRLFSTVTTALTVAVAVALLLTLLSMRKAGEEAFQRGSGNMHLLVSGDASPMVAVLNGVFYANAPARPLPIAKAEELAADPRVAWAIPLQLGDNYEGFPVVATRPEFFTQFKPDNTTDWKLREGKFFTDDWEVTLGSTVAAATGLKIGDKIYMTHGTATNRDGAVVHAHVHEEFAYRVVGILERSGTPHDRGLFTTLNSSWIVHAHERAELEGGHDHDHHDHEHEEGEEHHDHPVILTDADRLITGVYIQMAMRPGASVSAAMPQFASELRRQQGFTVASPADEMNRLFKIVANIDIIFRAMAVIVLVSSAIAIMLALYNSMNERRRQIAVLRVLGSSRMRIFGLIVTESAILGVLGVAAGLALTLVGGAMAAKILQSRVGLVIQPAYSLEWVLGVAVGTILLAAAAGIVPAWMAYRTSVAKNLKPIG